MAHFRVLVCLCVKTSLSAKPKPCVSPLRSFSCKSNSFSCETFCTKTRFETEANQNSEMGYSLTLFLIVLQTNISMRGFSMRVKFPYLLTYLLTYLLNNLLTYPPTYLPTYLPTYVHTYSPTYLLTYVLTNVGTYVLTYLLTYQYYKLKETG